MRLRPASLMQLWFPQVGIVTTADPKFRKLTEVRVPPSAPLSGHMHTYSHVGVQDEIDSALIQIAERD